MPGLIDELLIGDDDGQNGDAADVGEGLAVDEHQGSGHGGEAQQPVQVAEQVALHGGGDHHHADAGADDHLDAAEPCHVLQQQLGVIHEHIGDDESGQGQSHRLPACFHGTAAGQTRRSEGGQGHRGGQVGEHGKVEAEQMGGQLGLAQLHQSGGGDGGGDQIGGDGGQAHAQDHAGDHGEHQSEQHALLADADDGVGHVQGEAGHAAARPR